MKWISVKDNPPQAGVKKLLLVQEIEDFGIYGDKKFITNHICEGFFDFKHWYIEELDRRVLLKRLNRSDGEKGSVEYIVTHWADSPKLPCEE